MHRRTITAATSLALPMGFALLVGVTGTLVDLTAIASIAKPWATRPSTSSWYVTP